MEQESRMWSLPKDVTSTNVLPVAHLKAQQQQLCTSSLCRPCQTWVLPVKSGGDTPVPPPRYCSKHPQGALCPSLRSMECSHASSPLLLRTGSVQPSGAVPPPRPQAPGGGSLQEEEERLGAPGGHADPRVPCLPPSPSPIGCSKMWDNVTCWPATPRGQVAVLACPFGYDSPLQGKSPGLERRS